MHVLVIPTRHVPAVRDAKGADGERLLGRLLAFAAEVASELGLDGEGYRIVTNTGQECGSERGPSALARAGWTEDDLAAGVMRPASMGRHVASYVARSPHPAYIPPFRPQPLPNKFPNLFRLLPLPG